MSRLTEWRGHRLLCLAARLYIGGVFVSAAVHKIIDPGSFAVDIATYGIMPLALINIMAITMPWVEIVAGGMAIAGLRARAASLLMAAMMVLFIAAISIALVRGLEIGCGCFASSAAAEAHPISLMTVWRDLGWFAAAFYPALFDRRPLGLDAFIKSDKSSDTN